MYGHPTTKEEAKFEPGLVLAIVIITLVSSPSKKTVFIQCVLITVIEHEYNVIHQYNVLITLIGDIYNVV